MPAPSTGLVVPPAPAQVVPPGSEPGRRLQWRFWPYVLALTIVLAAGMCIHNHAVFVRPIHEYGDWAANSIEVNQAVHFNLLVGNYSREGFHHPGPAFLYIQSFGQDLFFAFLHLVPSPYNGQLIAVYLLNAFLLALTAAVLARHARSYALATAAIVILLLTTADRTSWGSSWMPHMYQAPFLLAIVAGVSVAVGCLRDLPLYVLAVGLLVHGHVAFIPIMGVFSVLVFIGWLAVRRSPRGGTPSTSDQSRAPIWISGLLAGLFLLPIVVELALHWPGPWGSYVEYLGKRKKATGHTLAQVFHYFLHLWPSGWELPSLMLAAGVAAVGILTVRRELPSRRFLLGLLVAFVVVSAETVLYAFKGVDLITKPYTGLFYAVAPALLVVVLVLALGDLMRGTGTTPGLLAAARGRRVRRRGLVGVQSLLVAALVWIPLQAASFRTHWPQEGDVVPMAAAIERSPLRHDRVVVVDFRHSYWFVVVGLVLQASRVGLPMCANSPKQSFLFTSQFTCTTSQIQRGWQVVVSPVTRPTPGEGPAFWTDRENVVAVERS